MIVVAFASQERHEIGHFTGMGRLCARQRIVDSALELIGILNLSGQLEEVDVQLKPRDGDAAFSNRLTVDDTAVSPAAPVRHVAMTATVTRAYCFSPGLKIPFIRNARKQALFRPKRFFKTACSH